jgi:succinoglycan biosynthesis protein ExoO
VAGVVPATSVTVGASAPRVSVVVPAYNVERYIGQAIASVLAQSEASLELLVVDDGSTDATRHAVGAVHDDRLRLLAMPGNRGQGAARNRALSEVRGEWVALLDADDWWAPGRLERLLEAAGRAGAAMVVDDCHLIEDGASRPWGSLQRLRGLHVDAPRLMDAAEFVRIDLGLAKPIIRRDVLVRQGIAFDEALHYVEDFAFYLECLLGGASLLIVPDAYYYYRARHGAVSSDRVSVLREHAEVAERLARDERLQPDSALRRALARAARQDRSGISYYELVRFLKAGRITAATRVVLRSPGALLAVARHLPTVLRARLSRLT